MNKFILAVFTAFLTIQGVSTVCAEVEYVVQEGDTLHKIAETYQVDSQELSKYNKMLNANRIYVGQTLLIPVDEVPVPPKQDLDTMILPAPAPSQAFILGVMESSKDRLKPQSSAYLKFENALDLDSSFSFKGKKITDFLMQEMEKMNLENIQKKKGLDDGLWLSGEIEGKEDSILYLTAEYRSNGEKKEDAALALGILNALEKSGYQPNKTIRVFFYQGDTLAQLNYAFPKWEENCFALLDCESITKEKNGYQLNLSCDLAGMGSDLTLLAEELGMSLESIVPEVEEDIDYLKTGVPMAAAWIDSEKKEMENQNWNQEESIFIQRVMGKLLLDLDELIVKPVNLTARMKIAEASWSEQEDREEPFLSSEELVRKIKSVNNVSVAALAEGDVARAKKVQAEAKRINKKATLLNQSFWDKMQEEKEEKSEEKIEE